MTDPRFLTVREAARQIAERRLTAEALAAAYLDRIEARESVVGAWQYLDREQVLATARTHDAEPPRGPLHGIPIAVKDLIDTVDMPTAYGSSSGSAAAVADGMAPLGFGTQTAGSVIRPAAYCGCIGYKPSFGLINRAGVKPLADSLDTIGVLANSVEDAAFFAGVLSERPPLRHLAALSETPRFGLYRTPMWDEAEPETAAALDAARQALERAGAAVAELMIAPEHHGLAEAQNTIMRFEAVRAFAYERTLRSAELSPRFAQMLDAGMSIGADEYDRAVARAAEARAGLEAFFGSHEAVLVPAAPGEAPLGLGSTGDPIFNRMWTLLGVPCVTVPASWSENGLPTGVQLVGRTGDDPRLMACAVFLERALAGS